MLFMFLWKFGKTAFFFSRSCIKFLKQVTTIQSVILVPLVLVLLLLPHFFGREQKVEEVSHGQEKQPRTSYGQTIQAYQPVNPSDGILSTTGFSLPTISTNKEYIK